MAVNCIVYDTLPKKAHISKYIIINQNYIKWTELKWGLTSNQLYFLKNRLPRLLEG